MGSCFVVVEFSGQGSCALGLDPPRRWNRETETGVSSGKEQPLGPSLRALTLPEPALSRVVGPVRAGEILLLSGASDLLCALAHMFVVEAVRERPESGASEDLARERRAVVIDGCNSISPYLVQRIARQRGLDPELLMDQIELARAFTAHQLVTLLVQRLEGHLSRSACDLLVVLGWSDLFEDPDLGHAEARQLAAHVMERVRLQVRRHGVPCLVTAPSASKSPNSSALERIVRSGASRVVEGLSFNSLAAASGAWRQALWGENDALGGRQRGLEEWGAMPTRPVNPPSRTPAAFRSEPWGAPARGPRGALRP